MNELEATRAKLKCLEMVEGTGLYWWNVIRHKASHYFNPAQFAENPLSDYEFALGVVEGKPVFANDEVFCPAADAFVMQNGKRKLIADSALDYGRIMMQDGGIFSVKQLSWNPPAPKTVMVELPIEFVEHCANLYPILGHVKSSEVILKFACKKSLEQIK